MKARLVIAAAALGLALSGSSAMAAITLDPGSFGGSNGVHSTPGLNAATVTGTIAGTQLVTLSTIGDTLKTSGGGLSKFEGGDGAFDDLTIIFSQAYSKVTFNLNTINKTDTSFSLFVNDIVGPFVVSGLGNGENKYILTATGADTISKLSFTFDPGVVDIRQIRTVDVGGITPVPEPATWAMMIVGFAGIGAMLRRARRRTALAFA